MSENKIFPEGMGFDEALNRIARVNPEDLPEPTETNGKAKPFVKWAGGKRQLLDVLIARIPPKFRTYHEPFLGGGALFWRLVPEKAILSDVNIDLVITYRVIQETPLDLIESLKRHKENHSKTYFYAVRDNDNIKEPVEVAARFIYLNKTCYNGLYRVNRSGKFNVPFGRYVNPAILEEKTIMACHSALEGVEVRYCDFSVCEPSKNDFVYLDPPYYGTYSGYSKDRFGIDKHRDLSDYCKKLDKSGAYFMLSNSDTPEIRDLYKSFLCETVEAPRTISCKGSQRKSASELLVRNYQ